MSIQELYTRGGPPVIPEALQVYNSYAIDPTWQMKYTIIWTSILAFTTLLSVPYIIKSLRNGKLFKGLLIRESFSRTSSTNDGVIPQRTSNKRSTPLGRVWSGIRAIIQTVRLWTLPMPSTSWWKGQVGDCCRKNYFSLSVGQLVLIGAYMGGTIACYIAGAQLTQNSNRPGFLALAQLPLIILLSLKSPLPLPVFLPTLSYTHYNFLHRWAGRTLFLSVSVHGGMWLNQFITLGEWDQVWADKSVRGMLAYGLMGAMVLTSLKPIRRRFYQVFWAAHVALMAGFFAAVSYHTPYAANWVYASAAIYSYDLLVRLCRYRIKDASLIPVDDTLTMIHIPDCDAGWLPTQHVQLRVFSGSGIFEAHPFTITNAPSTFFSASPRGIILYAKVCGEWTKKLHDIASAVSPSCEGGVEESEKFLKAKEGGRDHPGKKVMVMIDGPYGGLKLELGDYESVLLVAGGSGITFVLGAIEEALRVCEKGRGPQKVEVAWVVRDLSTIEALAPTLLHLHNLATQLSITLSYNLYLTKPSTPLPESPALLPSTTTLSPYRPEISQLVREILPIPIRSSAEEGDGSQGGHGGLAVIACGPEGIVMEARNAVAALSVSQRIRCGGVAFHGETYAL